MTKNPQLNTSKSRKAGFLARGMALSACHFGDQPLTTSHPNYPHTHTPLHSTTGAQGWALTSLGGIR